MRTYEKLTSSLLKVNQELSKLKIVDRLRQESVHASCHGTLLEASFSVGCAAAQIGEYLLSQVQDALFEDSTNLSGNLRPIHLWHTVVE